MEQTKKYKIFNRDMMKCLAIFIMFWGHLLGWVLMDRYDGDVSKYYELPLWELVLIYTSLFCPPVMFFFIADGYKYTHDRKKYAKRLFIFACIAQRFRLWQRIGLILLCIGATAAIQSDWFLFGILYILFLHCFREKTKARAIAFFGLSVIYFGANLFSLGTVPTVPLLVEITTMLLMFAAAYLCMTVFYNGRKGKHPTFAKWFFYIFYPLHYFIIWVVERIANR